MCGTDISYAAMTCAVLTYRMLLYAMCGTDVAYGAMQIFRFALRTSDSRVRSRRRSDTRVFDMQMRAWRCADTRTCCANTQMAICTYAYCSRLLDTHTRAFGAVQNA
eukprot:1320444-Rhodomonas_salina.1